MNAAQHALVMAVRIYQATLSPMLTCLFGPLGLGCRFHPTCSQYALEAVRRHGAIKGGWLALCRIGRCHPWGGCGEDPVPEQFRIARLKSHPHRHESVLGGGISTTGCVTEGISKPDAASNRLLRSETSGEAAQSR
jgi:putative membrane protein insertion efficiency factor